VTEFKSISILKACPLLITTRWKRMWEWRSHHHHHHRRRRRRRLLRIIFWNLWIYLDSW